MATLTKRHTLSNGLTLSVIKAFSIPLGPQFLLATHPGNCTTLHRSWPMYQQGAHRNNRCQHPLRLSEERTGY